MLRVDNGASGRQPDRSLPLQNPRQTEGMLLFCPKPIEMFSLRQILIVNRGNASVGAEA
jgi:hypothetical protein